MSYDIYYRKPTGGQSDSREPTYNVAPMFRASLLHDDGIRSLHGVRGRDAVPLLSAALRWMVAEENADAIEAMQPVNGWGSAQTVTDTYLWLLSCAAADPDGMIDTEYGRGIRLIYDPEAK